MNAALVIIFAFLLLSLYLGVQARKGKDMNLEQWTVGGRGFGTIFVFLLMAGEIYTTFTFLGGSGWAYGKGGPTFYIIAYGCLAYVLSYWMLPKVWKYAKEHELMSQSDFFVSKYNSPLLGVLVSLVGVVALIPYLVLQLKGLGIIVSQASYGTISPAAAIWIGVLAVTVYVTISGIHGSAWTAVVKDAMILVVAVFLGIYLPFHYYGGIQPMFEAIEKAKPGFLALPDKGMSVSWFISTVLLTVLGFYMWPHTFGSIYSAKSANVFRKNAIILPIYQLVLLFVFLLQTGERRKGDMSRNIHVSFLSFSIICGYIFLRRRTLRHSLGRGNHQCVRLYSSLASGSFCRCRYTCRRGGLFLFRYYTQRKEDRPVATRFLGQVYRIGPVRTNRGEW
ncbi:solute:Na+ symporter, SSS family [Parageobacillus thermantarcticus]|uniref:Solute:Na+ symporter, SSS family n=1 Tax=Parageobacillus thermantarcticus TaxID=186116 RepID=A0A1I0TDN2_9BACL|nr:solute:Na+ symporter, SSS family [Parageobacillus thermantarcticus]